MNNKNKRELLLKILRQNIEEGMGEKEREESPVSSYSVLEGDKVIKFAEQFIKDKGRFVYCENEKDFINKLQSLIQYRKWENILSFSENLHLYLKHIGVETTLHNPNAIVGISLCHAMIANVGSFMVTSQQGIGSNVNKLPSIFIIVAHTSQIYSNYKEALQPLLTQLPQHITTLKSSEALSQSVVEFYLYLIDE
jgi:L-lactate dehydrogenase complex protein LldG